MYVCTVCVYKKGPQKPLEHTPEHAKSQFPGGVLLDPPRTTYIMDSTLSLSWPPQTSQVALVVLTPKFIDTFKSD